MTISELAKLEELYDIWNDKEKAFEVVVVSGDRDQAGFDSTMKGSLWVASNSVCRIPPESSVPRQL